MYWLIVERNSFRMRVYTTPDGEALPVFSHEGEAASFLGAMGLGGGWRARETSVGELVSLLLGPYADVSGVALDPPTGDDAGDDAGSPAGLVSVDRKGFVDHLMRRSRADAARMGADR